MAKRRPINSIRDFPRFCGRFGTQNKDESIGFFGNEEHHSPITSMKRKSHLTLGGSRFEKTQDGANNLKESSRVLGKRPLKEDNCKKISKRGRINSVRNFPIHCGSFGIGVNSDEEAGEHHSPKSFGNGHDCDHDDDNNHIVNRPVKHSRPDSVRDFPRYYGRFGARDKEKSINFLSVEDIDIEAGSQNDSVESKGNDSNYDVDNNSPVSNVSANKNDQAKMSKRWEFEWVEVDRTKVKVDDDVSFLSPFECQNLTCLNKNRVDLSNNSVEEAIIDEPKDPGNALNCDADGDISSEIKVQEVLNMYHEQCTNLYGGVRTNQVYVKAAMILKKENKWLNSKKAIGHVPGVKIGDQFQFRAELVVVGLHHEFQSAISCATISDTDYAISIVDSGMHENKGKPSNTLIYTVQGGNSKVQAKCGGKSWIHQKGKLALKNSMDAKLPVRVIRKVEVEDKKIIYFYDGLYNVIRSWAERSKTSKFMFEMVRLEGQPDCDGFVISKQRVSIKHKESRVVISEDLSGGKEKFPILVVNDLNDEKPEPFTYISDMISTRLHEHHIPRGCDCVGGCSDLHKCACVKNNKGEIPFNEEGSILKAKKRIYECGPNCKCPPSCLNRVSQHGPRLPLEVFKTKSTGWGIRSREEIQSGSFICEYLGELMEDLEADLRTNDEYLLDLDDGTGFTIDAAKYGNVGRFINHSCSPNLYAQNVFYDHEDTKLPHVMFFATKKIPALQELTYHYDYKINGVLDANGNIKKKECCCGSRYCKKRLY